MSRDCEDYLDNVLIGMLIARMNKRSRNVRMHDRMTRTRIAAATP
jgi:hypothetical protein